MIWFELWISYKCDEKNVDLNILIVVGFVIQNEMGMTVIIGKIDVKEKIQMSVVLRWYGRTVDLEKLKSGC